MEGQRSFRWFGEIVGDGGPLPAGFTEADMGKCDHAIRIKGDMAHYEIGVCQRRDGKPGFTLLWDSWEGVLQQKAGDKCGRLVQGYAAEVAIRQARRQGFRVQKKMLANGKIQLVCSR
jgi:hypothetical protein